MKVYLEVYGCAAAQSDSEIMSGLLTQAGYTIIDNIDHSDAILITTCDVKQVTEQKTLDRLAILAKKYPNKRFIIVGCMVDNRLNKIKKILPTARLVGTNKITEIITAIEKNIDLTDKSKTEKICLPRIRKDKSIGIVQISEGCRGSCNFCSTRLAKGTIYSYPIEKILEDVSSLIRDGCNKIYLTSQDTGAYGFDLEERSLLPKLLEKASAIEGDFTIRIGMMNPDNIILALTDLISAYRNKKIIKFLHLPVQSGSNQVLKAMNRHYTIEQFKTIVSAFRQAYPEIVIWTDIIVGYPSESEQQFQATLNLLKEIKPNYTHISRFAKREGTPAASLKQFPTEEMKRRTRICSELVRKLEH